MICHPMICYPMIWHLTDYFSIPNSIPSSSIPCTLSGKNSCRWLCNQGGGRVFWYFFYKKKYEKKKCKKKARNKIKSRIDSLPSLKIGNGLRRNVEWGRLEVPLSNQKLFVRPTPGAGFVESWGCLSAPYGRHLEAFWYQMVCPLTQPYRLAG